MAKDSAIPISYEKKSPNIILFKISYLSDFDAEDKTFSFNLKTLNIIYSQKVRIVNR